MTFLLRHIRLEGHIYNLAQSTRMEEMFAFMKSTSITHDNLYRSEEKEKIKWYYQGTNK
jgi:hypothetical protein